MKKHLKRLPKQSSDPPGPDNPGGPQPAGLPSSSSHAGGDEESRFTQVLVNQINALSQFRLVCVLVARAYGVHDDSVC